MGNFSSAKPDVPTFTGVNFTSLVPLLGTAWISFACRAVVESTVSQDQASLEAAAAGIACASSDWQNPVNGDTVGPISPPVPPPVAPRGGNGFTLYQNEETIGDALCPDGTLYSFTVAAGSFIDFTQAGANAKAQSYANNQALLRKICLTDILDQVCVDSAYSQTIVATGLFVGDGGAPNNWELVGGQLPPGLTFNGGMLGNSATITGTTTVIGQYQFVISVTDPDGNVQQKEYQIVVAGLTNVNAIPDGTLNDPYSFQLTSSGFDTPIYFIAVGSLPDGLTLSASGLISGTPTMNQTKNLTFEVAEENGTLDCQGEGTIVINGSAFTFANTIWNNPPDILNGGTGTATATFAGADVQIDLFRNDFICAAANTNDQSPLLYTGPGLNCNIHAVITNTNPGPNSSTGLVISQDGNDMGYTNSDGLPSGTYDFPVTLAAGVDSQIVLKIAGQLFFGAGNSLSMTVTLTP